MEDGRGDVMMTVLGVSEDSGLRSRWTQASADVSRLGK